MSLANDLGVHASLVCLWDGLRPEEQMAAALVWLAHQGRSLALHQRFAIKWWSEFLSARVTLAARVCSSLSEWSSEMARRLHGQIGGTGEDGERQRSVWQELIVLPEERQRLVLDVLERQAQSLVTLVRADMDARRTERFGPREPKISEVDNGPAETIISEPAREPGLFDALDIDAGVGAVESGEERGADDAALRGVDAPADAASAR